MSPRRRITILATALAIQLGAQTAPPPSTPMPSAEVRPFLKVEAPVVALVHARVVDGTGSPAREDQTLILRNGRIDAMGAASALVAPREALVLDLAGHTVLPGLVGMHNHLFYTHSIHNDDKGGAPAPGRLFAEIAYSAPRLYLACGITTIRTTGSLEPYTDLNVKRQIDAGLMPGPKMDVTGPYLEGLEPMTPQMYALRSPEDARRFVDFWADAGVTSFKAYMNIRRADLGAAIQAAHARGRVRVVPNSPAEVLLKKEMAFELAFAKAGGLLLAGPDPTGMGGVLPGFGDHRELELLVEAGFTPVEAIHIATANGAAFLGRLDRIGTLAPGKQADLVVVKGDPSTKIEDLENVVTVFKDGLGYDTAKLIESVRAHVGIR